MEELSVERLQGSLATKFVGKEICIFDSVSSTQDVARELLNQGASDGTVVLAETQTKGKGRLGRDWFSPRGVGIWASLILHPKFANLSPESGLTAISLTCSVAIANAIRKVTGLRSFIKWPNDVLLHQKKVAGILVEMAGESIIVGIGINVNQEQFPESLRDSATSLMIGRGRTIGFGATPDLGSTTTARGLK